MPPTTAAQTHGTGLSGADSRLMCARTSASAHVQNATNTSELFETLATASMCTGCTANHSAASVAGTIGSTRRSIRQTMMVTVACSATAVRWYQNGTRA